MQAFRSLLRPDEKTGAAMRWAHRVWVFLWLTVFGLGIGLLSLYLTANSYAGIDAQALWASYMKLPLLVVLRGPLTAAYAVSGYHVGSAALALRVWQAVRP